MTHLVNQNKAYEAAAAIFNLFKSLSIKKSPLSIFRILHKKTTIINVAKYMSYWTPQIQVQIVLFFISKVFLLLTPSIFIAIHIIISLLFPKIFKNKE